MMNEKPVKRRGTPDFQLLILTFLLVGFGVLMVFSASSSLTGASSKFGNDPYYFLKKQAMWAVVGTLFMFVAMNLPLKSYKKLFKPLFLVTVLLLIAVLFTKGLNGASSWLQIVGLGIQPTELAKIASILYLAALITKKGERFRDLKTGYVPVTVIVGFIAGLIMLQPDFGSCFILVATCGLVIYAGGASTKHMLVTMLILIVTAALMFGVGSLFGSSSSSSSVGDQAEKNYKMGRIEAFLNPSADKQNTSYNLYQSLMGIGEGGITGSGFGQGIIKLHYLPNPYNDFIFSVIGEEFGLIGTGLFLLLYLYFIWRGMLIALRCPDPFGTLVGTGVMGLIAIQAFINIGGVTKTIPLTGVTLPFISYGGSSLLAMMLSMGIMLSISRESKLEETKETTKSVRVRRPTELEARRSARFR
ncbi:putative lipid II flippase FtsW [Paenibacillus sp. JX-17]|uniref:Probable peptidoglycan glycosyltransferase FtsW n=1 Tax=Paenibacillus lacisoli TaxID=3064525 RepID=A0ABT9C7M9_9BACL|nr:putative lipid II flippase FtsW [Paenibacillus sp. JX-17]MDO7905270.1 putative lipid II flippase FtsW [Paenibacillus sp. JX-17]